MDFEYTSNDPVYIVSTCAVTLFPLISNPSATTMGGPSFPKVIKEILSHVPLHAVGVVNTSEMRNLCPAKSICTMRSLKAV